MDYEKARKEMVRLQLESRGISNARVLQAMRSVPREEFLSEEKKGVAYIDSPLSIPSGQTISQPYILARLLEILDAKEDEEILEIGTGSGYSTAVLAQIAKRVVSIERDPSLLQEAARALGRLGIENVELIEGDGSLGLSGKSFPGIIVHASAPKIPTSLLSCLTPGGRMVLPLKREDEENLYLVAKDGQGITSEEKLDACRFVPLLGQEAF